jgi:hypothetical protein
LADFPGMEAMACPRRARRGERTRKNAEGPDAPVPVQAPFTSDGGGLFEALDRGGFVIFHVEDGIQFGDLQQVVHLLGEVE